MICLTYDTDHMSAEGMQRFLAEMAPPGQGTFFLWQRFEGVDWHGHEIAPHPYLTSLDKLEEQIRTFTDKVGIKAAGVRMHSCAYAHTVGVAAKACGLKYVSMASHPPEAGLHPYRHPWGVWEMPIYYMDNMDFCTTVNWPALGHKPFAREIIDRALDEPGLYVFDFHPLHLALNTTSFEAYQAVKGQFMNGAGSPWDCAMPGYGTRTFYLDLLGAMCRRGLRSHGLEAALGQFEVGGMAALSPASRKA